MLQLFKIKQLLKMMEKCKISKTVFKWIGCNMFNMNASKLSLRKNTKKGLNFSITELKKGKHNKDHIKMLIWFWCKIILVILTTHKIKLEIKLAHNLKQIIRLLKMAFLCRHLRISLRIDLLFLKGKIEETHLIITQRTTKPTANLITKKTIKQVKVESNTTNSISIQPNELSKWWENSINQLL